MTKEYNMGENNFQGNIGKIPTNKEPYVLTDIVTEEQIYVGTSQRGNQPEIPSWRIKKIWKDGNIWYMGFPDGNQSFSFIWDDRGDYDYE
jgi:hypothetical protein